MTHFPYAEFSAAFPWFFPVAVCLLGACVGSFLNVVIYRVPKEESIVTPGSHCACGQPIRWHDNIPILSWLLLRGRARCCGRNFSFRYPFVELLTAALFVACWLRFSSQPAVAACGWIFLSCLIAATFIDLDHFIIPDAFTLGLGVAGVLLSVAVPGLHGQNGGFLVDSVRAGTASLLGLLVGSGLVLWILLLAEVILKKEAMGFGDVKFVGALGAFCGWQGAVFAIFGGALVGTAWFALAWVWQKVTGRSSPLAPPAETPEGEPTALAMGAQVPFGPMLAVAAAGFFLAFRGWVAAWFAEMALLF
jgi:leader peptidase (prepilin peptidase)/N-methyltransferase